MVFLVSSCDDLTCGENEICVAAGDTYECACHPDYEGENCEETGLFFDVLEALLHVCAAKQIENANIGTF